MSTILERDRKFKEAIGAFIIAFSEMEYGLAHLSSMTEFNLIDGQNHFITHVGYPFERKVTNLSTYIESELPELKSKWSTLKEHIQKINRERRFIAHGFNQYFLSGTRIMTYVKEGKNLSSKQLDTESIHQLTNQIQHIKTGENGINGEFLIEFTTARINKWNSLVNKDYKITYRVNGEIVSEWKGDDK